MGTTIQARLDPESQKRLAALVRQLGWTPSKVVREALRVFASRRLLKRKRKIIGLGQFDAGVSDLGSNKKYLEDFGR
jgi:predicted transcriptional regulator